MATGERTPLLKADASEPPPSLRLPHELSRRERFATVGAVWLGVFLGALDQTIVAGTITAISSELGASNNSSWLGTSYLLSLACFTPLYGKACDIAGRRAANLIALFFFSLGTLLCGIATDMRMLIAARLVAGIGGGGLMSTSSIIASDLVAPQHRGVVQGLVNIMFGLGAGLGGPLGGFLADNLGWRYAFLLQLPLLAVSVVAVTFLVRYRVPGQSASTRDKLRRIDYIGFITLLVWVSSLLIGLAYKTNEQHAWSSPFVYVPLVVSILFLGLFIFAEARFAVEPVMPLRLLRQRSPLAINAVNLIGSWTSFSVLYHYPSWFEIVQSTSTSLAGAHLIPNAIALSLGSLTAGFVIRSTGRYWRLIVISALLPVTSLLAMTLMQPDWPAFILWLSIMPAGFGFGSVITAALIALIAAVDRADIAVATGTSYLFRYTGQVVGVAVSSSVMQAVLSSQLSKRFTGPGTANLIEEIRHRASVIKSLPPAQRRLAIGAYQLALRAVFAVNLGTACLVALCALPIVESPLAKTLDEADELDRQRTGEAVSAAQASGDRAN